MVRLSECRFYDGLNYLSEDYPSDIVIHTKQSNLNLSVRIARMYHAPRTNVPFRYRLILKFRNACFRKIVLQHASPFFFVLSLAIDINCQRFCHGSSKWQLIKRALTRSNIENENRGESSVRVYMLRFVQRLTLSALDDVREWYSRRQ